MTSLYLEQVEGYTKSYISRWIQQNANNTVEYTEGGKKVGYGVEIED